MNVLTFDVETTTSNKGNPFDLRNRCLMVGLKFLDYKTNCFDIENDNGLIPSIQYNIDKADLMVGFALKFDLHWLRNIGINIRNIKVWDCQLAEFLISKQQVRYPSLNSALERLGLPLKLDVVKTEYWDKGLDTSDVPTDILEEYCSGDLVGTEAVYLRQKEELEAMGLMPLFRLQCSDLLVLEEMEYNGIKFSTAGAKKKVDEINSELADLATIITRYTDGVPINFNSDDDVSVLLYGGTIYEDVRIPVGVYKTGAKIGETRYKILTKEYTLPRLIEPIKGTERLKKDDTIENARYWYINDTVLRSLKPTKHAKILLDALKRNGELEKLKGTYLIGWTNLIESMGWETDMIHGSLNQCSVVTGRLSSDKPNLQNADPITKTFCVSRYDSTM